MADEQCREAAAQPEVEERPDGPDESLDFDAILAEAERKAEENRDNYLRLAAELDNVRKRTQRDLEHAHKFALEKFASELLPVKDSLELGLSAAEGEAGGLREGVDMTLKMLTAVLEKHGITEIDPLGEAFNPEYHEAMAMQPSDEAVPETVLNVVQKGYILNGRLLRPARVIVARAPGGAG